MLFKLVVNPDVILFLLCAALWVIGGSVLVVAACMMSSKCSRMEEHRRAQNK